ncbi:MAG TPA: hypothetical protein VEY92_05270 [Pseudoxanthomonas sp.]|nr:hypothetical protein [Pseudoxanthomonas sp.]
MEPYDRGSLMRRIHCMSMTPIGSPSRMRSRIRQPKYQPMSTEDMKMKRNPLVLMMLCVAFAGCATQSPKPVLAEIPQAPLTVRVKPTIAPSTGLRIVDRAATAKMVGIKTVVGILGAFGGAPITGFKKEDLKGEVYPELPDPSQSLLPNALETRLRSYAQAHPMQFPLPRSK